MDINKFRAIIKHGEGKSKHIITMRFCLIALLDDKFSNREILWPWLRAGNQPDRFSGHVDFDSKDIYGGDILIKENVMHFTDPPTRYLVRFTGGAFLLYSKNSAMYLPNLMDYRIIGNEFENPELFKEVYESL